MLFDTVQNEMAMYVCIYKCIQVVLMLVLVYTSSEFRKQNNSNNTTNIEYPDFEGTHQDN